LNNPTTNLIQLFEADFVNPLNSIMTDLGDQDWEVNRVLIKAFIDQIRKHEVYKSVHYSPDGVELSLWKDDRIAVIEDLPSQIGSVKVEIKWIECKVPPNQSWTVPILDFKPGVSHSSAWLNISIYSFMNGLIKKLIIDTEDFIHQFDGMTLIINSDRVWDPNPMQFGPAESCCFSIPLWIRQVKINCTYHDPIDIKKKRLV
jgi:hypothetical protein